MSKITIHVDGMCEPNPGGVGYYYVQGAAGIFEFGPDEPAAVTAPE